MDNLLVAWFMVEAPNSLPVLICVRKFDKNQDVLEVVNRVYEFATEKAQICGIHQMIYIGTYYAYHSLLTSCLAELK